MSIHTALPCIAMEGGEAYEPPQFCIEVNVVRGGRKLAVLQLHHGATPDSAVEITVDLHCKTVTNNYLVTCEYIYYSFI